MISCRINYRLGGNEMYSIEDIQEILPPQISLSIGGQDSGDGRRETGGGREKCYHQ